MCAITRPIILFFTRLLDYCFLSVSALKEGLSPDAIKQAIKDWLPDTMRV
jgi:hypothetical protein